MVMVIDVDSMVLILLADVSGLLGNLSFSDWGDGSGCLNWMLLFNSFGIYILVICVIDVVDSSLYFE